MRRNEVPVMKSRLHVIALVLFVASLLYNVIVWGGVRTLGDVGVAISDSARREAPLAATYIAAGNIIDAAVPSLGEFGGARLASALGDAFASIRTTPGVAMDLVFGPALNASHTWLRTTYWATPVLLLIAVITWVRRPKPVRLLRR
jgi:hypothetical protein